MKRSFCLALLCLLGSGLLLPVAADEPAPLTLPSTSAPSCSSATTPAPSTPEFMVPEPTTKASCTVSVLCRCGQRLTCTSAAGNCRRISGCSVTCDGNEQVCPPCNGFGCA